MDEEQIHHLFHACWFRRLVLLPDTSPPPPPPPQPSPPTPAPVNPAGEHHLPILRLHHRRSNSSSSPVSVLHLPKLDTILSGKESNSSDTETCPSNPPNPSKLVENLRVSKKKKNKKGSKSLSELEYEELRGFMDLGFVFPKDDIDSELVSILPGLQRWAGRDGEGELRTEADVPRPYLSESWSSVDGGKEDGDLLKGWRIPAAGHGVDMKDHLRCWAHAVASTVI